MSQKEKFNAVNQWCVLYLLTLMALVFTGKSMASVTQDWQKNDESNPAVIDHRQWQGILSRYVDTQHISGVNLFAYGKVNHQDKSKLENYLVGLQAIDPRLYSKAEQKAYWINLYNALTVRLILKNYPVKSITKLGEGLFSFGPWDDAAATIKGKTLSLNDIEHKILRPIWKDQRIHYAVNCASYSCPDLSAMAFTGNNTNKLLDAGAHAYINHPRGVDVDGEDLVLSSIYDWYLVDFGDTQESLLQHLKHYAKPDLKQKLAAFERNGGDIDHGYNWNLNESE